MKKIKEIIIVVLLLVIIGMVVVYFTILRNDKKDSNPTASEIVYNCDKTYQEENDTLKNIIYRQTITADATGEITSIVDNVIYTFQNKEAYDSSKDWKRENADEGSYNYKRDDKNLTLTLESKEVSTIKDGNGNPMSVWYKEYVKTFEENGYTCTKVEK